jgi:hypothetical protein
VKILTGGDLKHLVIRGKVLPEVLREAWAAISAEYADINKDELSKHNLMLLRDVHYLNNRIIIIEMIVKALITRRDENLIKHLRSMGFSFAYAEGPNYINDLKLTISQTKRLKTMFDQKTAELKKLQDQPELTETDYIDSLTVLSKWVGYRLDYKTISVAEYLLILNHFKAETAKHGIEG